LDLISLVGVDNRIVSVLKIEQNKKIRSMLVRTRSKLRRRMMPKKTTTKKEEMSMKHRRL
jgi:hypothetical protein